MQISQRLAVIEPGAFRHEAFDELQDAVGAIDEAVQDLAGIDALPAPSFIEPSLGPGSVFGRRQVDEGEEVARFEVRGVFLEVRLALGVDEAGRGVREAARRIGADGMALGLHEDGPAGPQAAEDVVEPAGDRHELGRHRGVEVGSAEARGALKAAVLVEDDALAGQCRPWQEVGEAG